MEKFEIEIIETLRRVITIEAETEEDALNEVNEQYNNADIVLGADDFIGVDIEVNRE